MSYSGYTPGVGGGYWMVQPGTVPASIVQTTSGGAIIQTAGFTMGALDNSAGVGAFVSSFPTSAPAGTAVQATIAVVDNQTLAHLILNEPVQLASYINQDVSSFEIGVSDGSTSIENKIFIEPTQIRLLHTDGPLVQITIDTDNLIGGRGIGGQIFAIKSDGRICTNQFIASPSVAPALIGQVILYDTTGAPIGKVGVF